MPDGNLRRSPAWRVWAGLLLLTLLVLGTLTWAFWNPAVDHGTAKAAVVDLDRPVTVGGKTIPLGRELADRLVNGPDRRYAWEVTDASDAAEGLRSGRYAAVVTVPEDFSKKATSFIAGSAKDATQAVFSVRTSAAARPADPGLSHAVVQDALASLNTTVVETYLDGIYVAFTEMHDRLGEAADGAAKLAEGGKELKGGAERLGSGATRLARGAEALDAGAGRLGEGADSLATGLGSLTTGAERLEAGTERLGEGAQNLATGAGRLAAGSTRLAAGVGAVDRNLLRAESRAAELPGLLERLATGTRRAARGDAVTAGRMVPVANRVLRTVDRMPTQQRLSADFHRLATRCAPRQGRLCRSLKGFSHRLAATAKTTTAFRAKVRARTVRLKKRLRSLEGSGGRAAVDAEDFVVSSPALARDLEQAATGARRLDAGLFRLRSATGTLARDVNRLEAGTETLSAGVSRLSAGAGRLATGTRQALAGSRRLASGAESLQTGAGTLAEGSRSLVTGTETLAKGAGRLETGARTLSKGLAEAQNEVPSYTEAERNHLKTVAATPMKSRWTGEAGFGRAAAAFFLIPALWACALGASLLLRALPPGLLTSRSSIRRLLYRTVASTVPAAAIGLAAGAVLGPPLGLGPGRWAALAAASALIALTFTLVCRALAAALGGLGLLLAAAVLVLTLAAGVLSSIPGAVASLSTLLPTHGAVLAVRALVLHAPGLPTGLLHLLTWLLLALAALAFTVVRRRSLRPRDLRLATA
ncbi:hypothetical protein [Actinocorallia libanotica]|uniref:YhgE/Pip-like protein n=1 Tax=Actinocorallia libanotica TaxID=46162 RepID=A0ABN1QF02_9ACTN